MSYQVERVAARDIYPHIVIMNRGQWYSPTSTLLDDVNGVLSYLHQAFPDALLIWRSTPIPHPNCSQYDSPIATPIPRSHLSQQGWNWQDLPSQAEAVSAMLRSNWTDAVIEMDVIPAMDLRPDGHQPGQDHDCVHYTLPGPQSHWVRLLYNLVAYQEHG